jgi:hypothetical protein
VPGQLSTSGGSGILFDSNNLRGNIMFGKNKNFGNSNFHNPGKKPATPENAEDRKADDSSEQGRAAKPEEQKR